MLQTTTSAAGSRRCVCAHARSGSVAGRSRHHRRHCIHSDDGDSLALALWRTGGHFFYTLDDPYIHLALAERIALGHYGINLGEVTSPSSSIIWPFLFVIGAGTSIHPYMPLAFNFVFGAIAAWLFGRFAAELSLPAGERATPYLRIAIAVLLVLATNQVGLAFTGMEHNLQVLVAIVAALGLDRVHAREARAELGARSRCLRSGGAIRVVRDHRRGRHRHCSPSGAGAVLAALCLGSTRAAGCVLTVPRRQRQPSAAQLRHAQAERASPGRMRCAFPLDIVFRRTLVRQSRHQDRDLADAHRRCRYRVAIERKMRTCSIAVVAAGLLHMLLGQFRLVLPLRGLRGCVRGARCNLAHRRTAAEVRRLHRRCILAGLYAAAARCITSAARAQHLRAAVPDAPLRQ